MVINDLINKEEILNYAISNDIIDISHIQKEINMKKNAEYLAKHDHEIWRGNNGFWYTYLTDEKKGRVLRKRKTRRDIEDLVTEFYMLKENEPTLKDVFEKWIESKIEFGEIQRQTYDRYKTDYVRFFDGTSIENKKIHTISEYELEIFIKTSIRQNKLSNKAYAGLRTILRGIFKYAKRNKWTEISISMFMGDMELSRKSFINKKRDDAKSVFTDEEVRRIFEYIKSNTTIVSLGIMLAFQTGLRVGEIVALKRCDLSENMLTVCRTEIRYRNDEKKFTYEVRESAKTDAGNRNVVLSKSAINTMNLIIKMNPFGEYLFEKNGIRIKETALTKKIYAICEYLNIEKRSVHKARKTYATMLINSGVDESIIIKQLGHTDISCTRNYYYFNNKTRDEVAIQIERAISI